jgi:hypothetical protein
MCNTSTPIHINPIVTNNCTPMENVDFFCSVDRKRNVVDAIVLCLSMGMNR